MNPHQMFMSVPCPGTMSSHSVGLRAVAGHCGNKSKDADLGRVLSPKMLGYHAKQTGPLVSTRSGTIQNLAEIVADIRLCISLHASG